jgi:hypothetical protein
MYEGSLCGNLTLWHSWCGILSEQVKVRIEKMKNIPEKYIRANLGWIRGIIIKKK